MAGADAVITIIPVLLTPFIQPEDRKADTRAIEQVTHTIAAHLVAGQMVCYETTLPVGTTRKILKPMLEASGLSAGVDFDLVFSPERVKSRSVLDHLVRVPKIVGGVNPASAKRAEDFYGTYLGAPVINLDSLEAAEFAKLAGMVYRDVNIALANELAAYSEAAGIDFRGVIAAANTDGESYLLSPGIGVGGHCTPVYPYFVLEDAKARGLALPLTAEARLHNDGEAARLLDRVTAAGLRIEKVLILGLGFRPGVKEHTLSSAFLIRDEARKRGAEAMLHDSLYSDAEIEEHGFVAFKLDSERLPPLLVLNTGHCEYRIPDFELWHQRGVECIVDGRNFWKPEDVLRAGLTYIAPGVPTLKPSAGRA